MIYKTKGTCSSLIEVELDGDIIKEVQFTGGCNGNLKGISPACKGYEGYRRHRTHGGNHLRHETNLMSRPACQGFEGSAGSVM